MRASTKSSGSSRKLTPSAGKSDLRGFEWYYSIGCRTPRAGLCEGIGSSFGASFTVPTAVWLPASWDRTVRLWDAARARSSAPSNQRACACCRFIRWHEAGFRRQGSAGHAVESPPVRSSAPSPGTPGYLGILGISPDGKTSRFPSNDGTVKFLGPGRRHARSYFQDHHAGEVGEIAFSLDGKVLAPPAAASVLTALELRLRLARPHTETGSGRAVGRPSSARGQLAIACRLQP